MKVSIELAASMLVAMFLISGLSKVVSLGASESERFAQKTGLGRYSAHIVFLAGVIELYGASLILMGIWRNDRRSLDRVHLGSSILIAFTAAATAIFYLKPFKYKPTLANMTTMAGLFLLPQVCELKH